MRSLRIKKSPKPPQLTMTETDQKIEQLVDSALGLLDDLRTTTDRVEDMLKKTREVSRQYASEPNGNHDGSA